MGAHFATTHWSQVLAARDGSASEARQALQSLCATYWQPLYAYVRHQGSDREEASDLTQAFFTDLLARGSLADVDPSKGRFRSFLLASLRHFLSRQRERGRAAKRGGGRVTLSLDVETGESAYASLPSRQMSPAEVFERRWAMTVLERSLERLRQEARESGAAAQVDRLARYLTSGERQEPYREAAIALGMTEGAVATAVHRLRWRYGECLRAEIAGTVADPADVDAELRHLLRVVRSREDEPP